ncbi:MAG: alpha/beta hydrolase [Hyphomonas sp.]|uniref:alpha/beta hydrolase n=1 Tax=Hyphomonas sp. TaxID=87 RepID=UPI003528DBC8
MSSAHLLDPQLKDFFESMPPLTLSRETIVQVRAQREAMALAQMPPLPPEVSIVQEYAPGRNGAPNVRMKIYRTPSDRKDRPAILHLHGGGYVLGSPESMAPQCCAWAKGMDAVVVAPAYRLGPETSYPGNVEDAYAALAWIYKHAVQLGIDTTRIAVAGESAGGGLAAALALLVRDRKEYAFCHQQLIFPMLDDRTAVRTDLSPMFGEFVWTNEKNHYGWASLLGHPPGSDSVSPYAAAARAEDLSGLPPAFISTGAMDLFTEENLDYAKRLMAAGVPVELHVYPGAPHGFMWVENARVTKQYARDAWDALSRGLGAA